MPEGKEEAPPFEGWGFGGFDDAAWLAAVAHDAEDGEEEVDEGGVEEEGADDGDAAHHVRGVDVGEGEVLEGLGVVDGEADEDGEGGVGEEPGEGGGGDEDVDDGGEDEAP